MAWDMGVKITLEEGGGTGAIVATVDTTRTYSQRAYIDHAEIPGQTAQRDSCCPWGMIDCIEVATQGQHFAPLYSIQLNLPSALLQYHCGCLETF